MPFTPGILHPSHCSLAGNIRREALTPSTSAWRAATVGHDLVGVIGTIFIFLGVILRDYRGSITIYAAVTRFRGWVRLERRATALLNGCLECFPGRWIIFRSTG